MRICFDLDGVLCTIASSYEEAKPLEGAAELLRDLKQKGHSIIIYTARGMGRSAGNQGLAVATIGALTIKQLDDWEFIYDELFFGKPSGDIYIDDKSIVSVNVLLERLSK